MKTLGLVSAGIAVSVLAITAPLTAQRRSPDHWVGTWATAVVPRPQAAAGGRGGAPPLNFNNQTLRQIVHVSLGGERVRVVLSNAFGTMPLPVGGASVALRQKDAAIVPGSARPPTFSGSASTTIAAGAVIVSDAVTLTVPALSDVAIDVFLAGDTASSPSPLTTHNGALQTSYVSTAGNHTGEASLPVASTTSAWYFLSAVDVAAPAGVGAVLALGDSITDGTLSTPDTNNRWPDHLARRLAMAAGSSRTSMMGVLNEGIAGNRVLSEFIGPSALARFDRDVLAQSGVTRIILLEGINDLGLANADQPLPTAAEIIAGYRQIVERAHSHGLKVVAGTLLPFEGTRLAVAPTYYSAEKDARRRQINDFIRTGHAFDGVVDFEAAVRDPQQPLQVLPRFKGADNLHLTDGGYRAMADAVPLALLRN